MAVIFTDEQITELILEPKTLNQELNSIMMSLISRRGHRGREFDLTGAKGNKFRLLLRQSNHNILDFSAILGVYPSNTNQLLRLRRYNGFSHEHKNKLEENKFYGYHIHLATERY